MSARGAHNSIVIEDDDEIEIVDDHVLPPPPPALPLARPPAIALASSVVRANAPPHPLAMGHGLTLLPATFTASAAKKALESEATPLVLVEHLSVLCRSELTKIDDEIQKLVRKRAQLEPLGGQLDERVAILTRELDVERRARESLLGHGQSGDFSWSRENFKWSADVKLLLKDTFGIQKWRLNQKEVINATIAGTDCFVLMPTGGGKSLLYQLPALVETGKFTLVISPLLSLSHDQLVNMNAIGVRAEMLQASTSREIASAIYAEMCNPRSDLKLLVRDLLVSALIFLTNSFCHCISQSISISSSHLRSMSLLKKLPSQNHFSHN
jgi:hypothetical protein